MWKTQNISIFSYFFLIYFSLAFLEKGWKPCGVFLEAFSLWKTSTLSTENQPPHPQVMNGFWTGSPQGRSQAPYPFPFPLRSY